MCFRNCRIPAAQPSSESEWQPTGSEDEWADEPDDLEKSSQSATKSSKKDTSTNADRMRIYRERMTPDQREAYNDKAKNRMKTYRKKLKTLPKTIKSDKDKAEQRKKWRKYKQTQREKDTGIDKDARKINSLSSSLNKLSGRQFKELLEQVTPRKKEYLLNTGIYATPKTRKRNKLLHDFAKDYKSKLTDVVKNDQKCRKQKAVLLNFLTTTTNQGKYRSLFGVNFRNWRNIKKNSLGERKKRKDNDPVKRAEATAFFLKVGVPVAGQKHAGKMVLVINLFRGWPWEQVMKGMGIDT